MGLDAAGRRIVECAMEFARLKELQFDLSRGDLTPAQQAHLALRQKKKLELLTEVGVLSGTANLSSPLYSG